MRFVQVLDPNLRVADIRHLNLVAMRAKYVADLPKQFLIRDYCVCYGCVREQAA